MPKPRIPEAYKNTTVSVARSKEEVNDILLRYGAEGIGWQDVWTTKEGQRVLVRFQITNRVYRLVVDLGDDGRTARQRMRALYWIVKAIMEQASFGIMKLEDLLLAYTEISDQAGHTATVSEVVKEQLKNHVVPSLTAGLKALPARGEGA